MHRLPRCADPASRPGDVGALWGIRTPQLQNSPFPGGINFPQRDAAGNALFSQANGSGSFIATTSPTAPDGTANTPLVNNIGPFQEVFLGDSPSPRLSVGIGVNWNSPFGPFRIDFSQVLLKRPGDDTKSFSFNVGTQF